MVRLKDEIIKGRRWHFKKVKGIILVRSDELKYYEPWTPIGELTKEQVIDIIKVV